MTGKKNFYANRDSQQVDPSETVSIRYKNEESTVPKAR